MPLRLRFRLRFVDTVLTQTPKSLKNITQIYSELNFVQQLLVGTEYVEITKSCLKPSADSV